MADAARCVASIRWKMISPKNDDSKNSTFGHRNGVDLQTATLHLSAADAEARGIRNADQVRMYNDRGTCLLKASVDRRVRLRSGLRLGGALGQSGRRINCNVNALTSDRRTDLAAAPRFTGCLVQVERSGD